MLPPDSGQITEGGNVQAFARTIWRYTRPYVRAAFALFLVSVVMWGVAEFLQLRGATGMLSSLIFLGIAWTAGVLCAFVVIGGTGRARWRAITAGSAILLLLVAVILHLAFPMPKVTTIDNPPPIHERPAGWRVIEDWQKQRIGAVLAHYPKNNLHIIAADSSDEAWDYATQFKELFKSRGWNVIGPRSSPIDEAPINIQLSISEKYWGKARPEAFTAASSIMHEVGIEIRPFVVDPLVKPDELVMWVGAKAPPGVQIGVPLQMVGETCQHPVTFNDAVLHFIGDKDDLGRYVHIEAPASGIKPGDRLLVLLTGPATKVANSDSFTVKSLGSVMPRPDALDVTLTKELKPGAQLTMTIISKKELGVRCVEELQ